MKYSIQSSSRHFVGCTTVHVYLVQCVCVCVLITQFFVVYTSQFILRTTNFSSEKINRILLSPNKISFQIDFVY